MPMSITVIAARSSIMPKPASLWARRRRYERAKSTDQNIGKPSLTLKAWPGDADFTAWNGFLRLHGDQLCGTRARRPGQRPRRQRGARSVAGARARRTDPGRAGIELRRLWHGREEGEAEVAAGFLPAVRNDDRGRAQRRDGARAPRGAAGGQKARD